MKPFWFSLTLLGLFYTLPAHAQRNLFKPYVNPTDTEWDKRKQIYVYNEGLAHWWLLCSYQQVRDKMVAEPGWDVYALDENFDNENALFVTNRREKISMAFYFTKVKVNDPDKLIRRRFIYPPDSPYIDEWTERLSKLPYDETTKEWTDAPHYAHIIKGVSGESQVVYELTVFFPKSTN